MRLSIIVVITIISIIVFILLNVFFLYIPVSRIESKVDTMTATVESTASNINQFLATAQRTEQKIDNLIQIAECLFASIEGPLYCRFFPSNCTNGSPNLTTICPSESSLAIVT